ncbi:MAG: hypothetical protein ACK522_15445, partial [Synechococcaceae cyanobacterium]
MTGSAPPSNPSQAPPSEGIQVIAMHGWAGDAANWGPWRIATTELPLTWRCGERGYGGADPVAPSWGPQGRRVVLAHSLGPHLLAPEVLAEAEAVVLLASFGRFVPPGRGGRRLRVALEGMAAALADRPDEATASARAQAMLRAFLARAAAPDPEALLPYGNDPRGANRLVVVAGGNHFNLPAGADSDGGPLRALLLHWVRG